ncbi:MAG: hypothetical protein AUJ71_04705 [Candidatus Omnitrophica bacterium CG1_02_49_16]|nr:MAG: hypothetical protein AUJ71_04705 [Candidatus Omnitrophica bacterium CG1_02_49_16]
MMSIYCVGNHLSKGTPCGSCRELLDYAYQRLDRCPFGEKKTACADCKVHCYQPQRRKAIVDVMRFAGPRMVFRHPLLAMFHVVRKKKPSLPIRQA